MTTEERIATSIKESLAIKQAILRSQEFISTIAKVGEQVDRAFRAGGKIFFFGNGGSAADAQHLASEFIGRFECERRALPAIALTTDTSALTAISNDSSFGSVFARQLEALASSGDIALGITTSGRSSNVIRGFQAAKEAGAVTVAMTGLHGKDLRSLVDFCICVPSDRTARIQEAHILIGHILCELVDGGFSLEMK